MCYLTCVFFVNCCAKDLETDRNADLNKLI
nr:MAG TPA: hypothetical protein [Caudoviricetes sp.]